VLWNSATLYGEDGREPVATIAQGQDITDRKRAEQQIQKHAEELERKVAERTVQMRRLEKQRNEAEKQAAIGRMAARIAHEINNPLAGIKNSFLLVKRAIPTDYKHYEFVGRIERELDRIARIVRQMFEVYKPERSAPAMTNMSNVLGDVAALLEGNARAQGVNIITDASEASDAVRLHEDSVRQVLFSLVQNAIEASPQGGTVKLRAAHNDNVLTLSIADEGSGISPEVGAHIFEPFFTTKSELMTGGLGLGLAITKGVVESLGGVLSYESEVGKGTTFKIHLPFHPDQNPPEAK
jgi:signal transduction histidine kinase